MKPRNTLVVSALVAAVLMSFYQAFDLQKSVDRGKTLYQTNCTVCHMPMGEGLSGAFPPLAGNSRLADKTVMIKGLIKGMSGPVVVKGVNYNGAMPAFPFSDQEAADVLNYIRNSWGNKYDAIRPAEIQPALKSK
jgi:mono/diheme cytochrome c family protein